MRPVWQELRFTGDGHAKRIDSRLLAGSTDFPPHVGGSVQTCSPCFTPGTLIATDRGQRPVEMLGRGDRIVTRDNGLKRIVWAGRRVLSRADLQELPELQPILVRRAAFGIGPDREMIVSPNHRFLVLDDDGNECLVPAVELLHWPGVRRVPVLGVSYLHILCEAHEVVLGNGAWTESFHPDDSVMAALAPGQRAEILALFPEIETLGAARRFPAARTVRARSRFEAGAQSFDRK